MNNSGKSNIIILILIPIFFIISLIIIDTFVSYNQNKIYKKTTENIIREVMTNDKLVEEEYYDEIKRLYELNNYETDNLVVDANSYLVKVDNEHSYFGIISSLTNKSGENGKIKILGIEFNVKKSSKIFVRVEARYNYEDELEIKFLEEE